MAYASDQPPWQANGPADPSMSGGGVSHGTSSAAVFNPAVVSAGRAAFDAKCTECHDAERSLDKKKDLAGWLSTVRRMDGKIGAVIAPGEVVPIATYLTSLNPAAVEAARAAQASGSPTAAGAGETPPQELDLFSTISLIHRSGVKDVLQNPGFFPEVWVGAEWRSNTPLSARVQACVTCHSEGGSSRVELAEGFLRYDVSHRLDRGDSPDGIEAAIDAGRFIVPFGAFAAKSHPGAFRTATRPLMYNMGQGVHRDDLGPPLLPMPYVDEGARVVTRMPIGCAVTATADGYVVNGLQGGNNLNFFSSRDYVDNNSQPAVGGRLTLGNKYLRLGTSIMSGRFDAGAGFGPAGEGLHYKIYGADLTARIEDRLRIHVEYAQRTSDLFAFGAGFDREELRGLILEGELRIWSQPRIAMVIRYDDQRRISNQLVQGSALPIGTFSVNRITWGMNVTLAGGLLIINHERWNVPDPLEDVDVLAIRWVAAF